MEIKQMYLDAGHPNRPGTKLSKVTGVVVHWTANEGNGADSAANRNYFNRRWKGTQEEAFETDGSGFRYASAHINVDDTTRVDCLPWKKGVAEMGYHVGGTYKDNILTKLGTTYPNNCTIGLEICVNADGDFKKAYANAIAVTAEMLKEHGLGMTALIRHYDVTGKLCPGFFTQDNYGQKYFGMSASDAYAKFRNDVQAALNGITAPPAPKYYKVYQQGVIYKYQFTTQVGAEDCAKQLFRDSGGKDTTIYATDLEGNTIYTPSKHPEDFPEYAKPVAPPAQYWRVFVDGVQQGAYSNEASATTIAKTLYLQTKSANILVKDPALNVIYTPSKHPEDFPELIVNPLDEATQKAVYSLLKKKFG